LWFAPYLVWRLYELASPASTQSTGFIRSCGSFHFYSCKLSYQGISSIPNAGHRWRILSKMITDETWQTFVSACNSNHYNLSTRTVMCNGTLVIRLKSSYCW
jgi:hypothetical protein